MSMPPLLQDKSARGALPYVFLILLAAALSLPQRSHFFGTDEGLYFHEALRVLQGDVMYRDFFEYKAPGSFFFLAGVIHLFGERIAVVRWLLFGIYLIEVCLLYWFGRRLRLKPSLALLPPLLYILAAKYQFWWSFRHHELSHFTAVLTAAVLILYIDWRRPIFLFAAGLLTGWTISITQHLGALLLVSIVFWAVWVFPSQRGDSRRRALLLVGSGVILPLIPFLIYLIGHAALKSSYECLVEYSFGPFWQHESADSYFHDGLNMIAAAIHGPKGIVALDAVVYYLALGYLPLIATGAGFIRVIRCWRGSASDSLTNPDLAVYGVLWTTSTALFAQTVVHPATFAIIQNSTLTFLFAADLLRREAWHFSSTREERAGGGPERRTRGLRLFLSVIVILVYADLGSRYYHAFRTTWTANPQQRYWIETSLGSLWTEDRSLAQDLTRVRDEVERRTSRLDRVFVYHHSPHLYLIVQRGNATRYSRLLPGVLSESQSAEVESAIAMRFPSVIIEDRIYPMLLKYGDARFRFAASDPKKFDTLSGTVSQHYEPCLITQNYTVYKRRVP